MAEFAAKGYGLTLGIHSRLAGFARRVIDAVPAGNIYINRNVIGAVVGVQPFGGLGLSGTGPKAGGPHYVTRFATEVTRTDNITAQGGDPALLNLSESSSQCLRKIFTLLFLQHLFLRHVPIAASTALPKFTSPIKPVILLRKLLLNMDAFQMDFAMR